MPACGTFRPDLNERDGADLVRDLLPDLHVPNGYVLEKVEGFTVAGNGQAFAVTENDGVGGSSGETQFLRLGRLSAVGRAASQQH